jgi:hypothetical protein
MPSISTATFGWPYFNRHFRLAVFQPPLLAGRISTASLGWPYFNRHFRLAVYHL